MSHPPGPWFWIASGALISVAARKPAVLVACNGEIQSCGPDGLLHSILSEDVRDTAVLLASAPELLEALETLRKASVAVSGAVRFSVEHSLGVCAHSEFTKEDREDMHRFYAAIEMARALTAPLLRIPILTPQKPTQTTTTKP